jgi:hypothetical protein
MAIETKKPEEKGKMDERRCRERRRQQRPGQAETYKRPGM